MHNIHFNTEFIVQRKHINYTSDIKSQAVIHRLRLCSCTYVLVCFGNGVCTHMSLSVSECLVASPVSPLYSSWHGYILFWLWSALSWQLTLSHANVTTPPMHGSTAPPGILWKPSPNATAARSPPSVLAKSLAPIARQRWLKAAPCPPLTLHYTRRSITPLLEHQFCPVLLLPYYFQLHSQQKPSFRLSFWSL